MNGYHNALVVIGVALLAVGCGYALFGRRNPGATQMDERIQSTWRRMTAWMLPAYLGISYAACLVLVASKVYTISVFAVMTYLWVTLFILGITFSVARRK